jgi:hypothetical protein
MVVEGEEVDIASVPVAEKAPETTAVDDASEDEDEDDEDMPGTQKWSLPFF